MILLKDDRSTCEYHLYSIFENADFDYERIEHNIGRYCSGREDDLHIFNPIEGDFKIFIFHNTMPIYNGTWAFYEIPQSLGHRFIYLKVDANEEIIDGYSYMYEWGECPNNSKLYKANASGIKLKDGLEVSKLKLINLEKEKWTIENGTIYLN